jgi:hypothetical protein
MKRSLIAIACLGAAGALPLAASSAPPVRSLSLGASPNPVVYGKATILSGKLTGANNAGKTVTLQEDPYPFGNFSNAGNATTGADGSYAFTRKPPVNTRYRTRQGNLDSSVVTELVRIRVNLLLSDSTPAAGERVTFSGRACPAHDGDRVAIQRRGARRWRTVKRTTLAHATRCSTYSTSFEVARDGRYRTVVAADADHARGISTRRRVNVH